VICSVLGWSMDSCAHPDGKTMSLLCTDDVLSSSEVVYKDVLCKKPRGCVWGQ
jgi:hypothetical protein